MLVVVRCLLLFLLVITIAVGTGLGTRVSYAQQIPCAGIECSTPVTPTPKARRAEAPPKVEASGGIGGCSAETIAGSVATAFAKYVACTFPGRYEAWWVNEPSPDAYFTFGAVKPGLWTACELTINMIARNRGGTASTIGYDCLKEARSSATLFHYAGLLAAQKDLAAGHSYYVRVRCYGKYAGHDFTGSFAYSPDLVWPSATLVGGRAAPPAAKVPSTDDESSYTPSLAEMEKISYDYVTGPGTATSGLPVLLDAWLNHQHDLWVLAESYSQYTKHETLLPAVGKEADLLRSNPKINWNANLASQKLFLRLEGPAITYAMAVMAMSPFRNETPEEVDLYFQGLVGESERALEEGGEVVMGERGR